VNPGAARPKLRRFDWSTGASPQNTLLQHTNGILYGTTAVGGTATVGTFYSFDAGLSPFVTYLPVYGQVGAVVKILGQGFTESSEVLFHGTPVKVKWIYPTYIRAMVPEGATSGPIAVTTANGTLTSNKVFIVHPRCLHPIGVAAAQVPDPEPSEGTVLRCPAEW